LKEKQNHFYFIFFLKKKAPKSDVMKLSWVKREGDRVTRTGVVVQES